MDTYWWICFSSSPEGLEIDQDQLFDLGAQGIEELDFTPSGPVLPQAIAPDPAEKSSFLKIKAFFDSSETQEEAKKYFGDREFFEAGSAPVEDWDRSWRDRQTPVEVTENLVVTPPWVAYEGKAKFIIKLEAKMAFGTGSHETTRIAALLMEKQNLVGTSVFDIGTGTGLLGLFAGLCGAKTVLALDIDPIAGPCIKENLEMNPMPLACNFLTLISESSAVKSETKFDFVICNMIRSELWPFREELFSRLKPNGLCIISGQRLEDQEFFRDWQKARKPRFEFVQELEMQGWWGFAARVLS